MIEYLWQFVQELGSFLAENFDPARDIIDIGIVTLGIYWLLLLIRGTRAIQILVGLIVLIAASVGTRGKPTARPKPPVCICLKNAHLHHSLPHS